MGDYWVLAARTADASVEPLDRAPPRGIHHHYGRLAMVTFPGTGQRLPRPLAALAPGFALREWRRTRGAAGRNPAVPADGRGRRRTRPAAGGIPVRFRDAGSGDILADAGNAANTGPSIVVATNAAGLAQVNRTLSQLPGCHDVEATLEDPPQGAALPVRFEARVREEGQSPDKFPTVKSLRWLVGQPYVNDEPVRLDVFNRGLAVEFSEAMSPLTLSTPNFPSSSTFVVTLELPQEEVTQGGEIRLGGHRVFIVNGQVEARDDNRVWVFAPRPPIPIEIMKQWLKLESGLFDSKRLRCRIVLKGHCILDAKTGRRPLDGDAFLRWADANNNGLQDPGEFPLDTSGDGRRGGDLETGFRPFLIDPGANKEQQSQQRLQLLSPKELSPWAAHVGDLELHILVAAIPAVRQSTAWPRSGKCWPIAAHASPGSRSATRSPPTCLAVSVSRLTTIRQMIVTCWSGRCPRHFTATDSGERLPYIRSAAPASRWEWPNEQIPV